ncbi:ABC transporter ATP-binding protein, partial [Enterobacter hormaechei]
QAKTKNVAEPVVAKAETVKKSPAKMSYNLQRELEGLPQRLEELEAAMEALQIQVADASFFTQPHDYTQKVLAELSQAEQALEEAFERW